MLINVFFFFAVQYLIRKYSLSNPNLARDKNKYLRTIKNQFVIVEGFKMQRTSPEAKPLALH